MALEAFEHAFHALQQRQFKRAADLLARVVDTYHDEKELQERARVYLAICQRQAAPAAAAPTSYEDRIGAATLSINRGDFDQALSQLHTLASEDASDDHVHYMLAVVCAARGASDEALSHLKHAVELNPDNRYLANQDVDLELVRQNPGYPSLLDAAIAGRRRLARKK